MVYSVNQRPALLKIAAVVSSLVLAGGYVLSQGGFSLFPSTKSGRTLQFTDESVAMAATDTPTTQPAAVPTTQTRRMLLPGSKSNGHSKEPQNIIFGDGHVIFEPVEPMEPPYPYQRTLLPGSKSFTFMPTTAPGMQDIGTITTNRTLMPGSKGGVFTPLPPAATPEPVPTLLPGSKAKVLIPTTQRILMPGSKSLVPVD